MAKRAHTGWAITAASLPMFAVALNNLVVTNALPQIANEFSATQTELEWVVSAYILAFAGLLLTGAALGDRYGRRRVFILALLLFTVGSVGCALSGSIATLIVARIVQGMGAAAVQPLSLTLVAAAVPARKRNAALGVWGGVNGLGVALGPVVGGAITQGIAWQGIFWINVPIGLLVIPLVLAVIRESRGQEGGLDLPGMALAGAAMTLGVFAIVQADSYGWTSPIIIGLFAVSVILTTAFVRWERRAPTPLLPLHFYRVPAFVLSNFVSMAMFFGVFGSIFFLNQFMQGPLGFKPFEAGLRTLPWTGMLMLVTPLAALLVDRIGGGRLMALGLVVQAIALGWLALVARIDAAYGELLPAMVLGGVGMGLTFAPTTSVVLGSVREHEHGKASGTNNTVREIGGALGVAVLTAIFTAHLRGRTLLSPVDIDEAFVRGMVPAMWVGIVVVTAGAVAALFIRRGQAAGPALDAAEEPADVAARA